MQQDDHILVFNYLPAGALFSLDVENLKGTVIKAKMNYTQKYRRYTNLPPLVTSSLVVWLSE